MVKRLLSVYPEREVRAVEGRQASFDKLRTNGEVPVHPEREVRAVEGQLATQYSCYCQLGILPSKASMVSSLFKVQPTLSTPSSRQYL